MKTVQLGTTVKRLDDETADRKVRNEGYSFVPKKVWKENVRDIDKEKKSIPLIEGKTRSNVKKNAGLSKSQTLPPPNAPDPYILNGIAHRVKKVK